MDTAVSQVDEALQSLCSEKQARQFPEDSESVVKQQVPGWEEEWQGGPEGVLCSTQNYSQNQGGT